MSDDVRVKLPADFILNRVFLTPAELAVGYRRHWIGRREAVRLALANLKADRPVTEAEEALALLLSDDLEAVDEIVEAIEATVEPTDPNPLRVWLYLVLSSLWENRGSYRDVNAALEQIYAEFDYPEEIRHFAGYGAPAGANPPVPTADRDWSAYLAGREAEYRRRSPTMLLGREDHA